MGVRLPWWNPEPSAFAATPRRSLADYAWYVENARPSNKKGRAWPVGQLRPNDLGFFDMLGNAFEWCANGPAEERGGTQILRGGSFLHPAANLVASPSERVVGRANTRLCTYGFRVARTRAISPFHRPNPEQ